MLAEDLKRTCCSCCSKSCFPAFPNLPSTQVVLLFFSGIRPPQPSRTGSSHWPVPWTSQRWQTQGQGESPHNTACKSTDVLLRNHCILTLPTTTELRLRLAGAARSKQLGDTWPAPGVFPTEWGRMEADRVKTEKRKAAKHVRKHHVCGQPSIYPDTTAKTPGTALRWPFSFL